MTLTFFPLQLMVFQPRKRNGSLTGNFLPCQVAFSGKPLLHPHLELIYSSLILSQHLPALDCGVRHHLIGISSIWIFVFFLDCELQKLRDHILFIFLYPTVPAVVFCPKEVPC